MSQYKIEAGTAQHIGNRPQQNDRTALFTGARAPGYVLGVLADSVAGGPAAAEQVLHTAKNLFDEFKPGDNTTVARIEQLLREIVHETHLVIKMNGMTTETEPMSTFAAVVLTPHQQAVYAYVGDSRVYHFQHGKCAMRSNDTAYIEHLIGTDKVSEEAARAHRHSKLLINVLGNPRKQPFVTVGSIEPIAAGDTFLLASDGLWHFFTDAELAAVTHKNTPRQASEMLINKAQERAQGKGDNCTMAIIKLVKPPKEEKNYKVEKMRRAV